MPNPLEYGEESDNDDGLGLFGSDDEDKGCSDTNDDIIPDTRRRVVTARPSTATSVSLNGHLTSQPVDHHGLPNPDQRYEELRRQRACLDRPPETGGPSLKWLTMRGE